VPRQGIGPVHFGMNRKAVAAAMRRLGAESPVARNVETDMYLDNAFQVSFGRSGLCEFIELASGVQASVIFEGIDVFQTAADDVLALVQRIEHQDDQLSEAPASFLFSGLILSLWDPDEQYDYAGGHRRPVFGGVGLGDEAYLVGIRDIRDHDRA